MNKEKVKKSLLFSICMFIIISIIVEIVFRSLELSSIALTIKKFDITNILENTYFIIAFEIVIVFISALIFRCIVNKKYIIDSSKSEFMHIFLIIMILVFALNVIINVITENRKLNEQLYAIEFMQETLINDMNNDIEKYDEHAKETAFVDCKTEHEIIDVGAKVKQDAIYGHLIKKQLSIFINFVASVIFVEVIMKDNKELFKVNS